MLRYDYDGDYEGEALVERLKTTKERVEYILENYPETRNDDLYLWLIYVRLFDKVLSKYIRRIPYGVIKRATRPETLSRVRRKIQEEGRLLPTDPKVLKRRRRLEELYRRNIHRV